MAANSSLALALDDVGEYVKMLKETSAVVQKAIDAHKTVEQLKQEKIPGALAKMVRRLGNHRPLHRNAVQLLDGTAPAISSNTTNKRGRGISHAAHR